MAKAQNCLYEPVTYLILHVFCLIDFCADSILHMYHMLSIFKAKSQGSTKKKNGQIVHACDHG